MGYFRVKTAIFSIKFCRFWFDRMSKWPQESFLYEVETSQWAGEEQHPSNSQIHSSQFIWKIGKTIEDPILYQMNWMIEIPFQHESFF